MTKLTLGALPNTQWQPLAPVLKALGWQPGKHTTPEEWLNNAKTENASPTILVYSHPNTHLAEALRTGATPSQALDQWQDQAQKLLNHFRQHRQNTLLINLEQALANPNALLEHAQQRFNISTNSNKAQPADVKPAPTDPDATDLIAFYLIRTSPAAQELLDRLEASTIPLTDETLADITPGLDADHLYTQLKESSQAVEALKALQSQQKAQAQQKADVEQENQLLITQLHKVQEELEQRLKTQTKLENLQKQIETEHKKSQTALKKANADLKSAQSKLEKLELTNNQLKNEQQALVQKKTELEEENHLIIEQLHKVQEELERFYLQQKDSTTQQKQTEVALEESQAALSASQKELKQLNTRLTKSETALKQANIQLADHQTRLKNEQQASQNLKTELTKATTNNKDLEDENRLILDQLFKVQEELEQQYLKNQELNGIQAQAEDLQKQLDKANTRLESLTQSLSWRATAPARALGKPFRKASPEARSIKNQVEVIRQAKALDTQWYTQTYPDVAQNGADPIEHFVRFGAAENRNPSPEFDTAWYKASYPDVVSAELNPLVHYIKFGKEEGRQPKP